MQSAQAGEFSVCCFIDTGGWLSSATGRAPTPVGPGAAAASASAARRTCPEPLPLLPQATEHYYVIFQNPVTVANLPYLLGRAPAGSCVRWAPGAPTRVHLVPRPGAAAEDGRLLEPRTFVVPSTFVFHHANAVRPPPPPPTPSPTCQ